MNQCGGIKMIKKLFGVIKEFLLEHVMLLVCAVFLIIGAILTPSFLTVSNLFSVMKQMSIVGFLAAGQSVAIITGGIDASMGGLLSASVIILALVQDRPLILVVIIVLGFSTLYGLLTGAIVSYFKIAPFITTLGMGTIGEGLALLLAKGRPIYVESNKDFFKSIGTGSISVVPYMVIIFFVVVIIGQLILSKTSLGLHWRAIGGNEGATYWSGINTKRNKMFAYAFSGLMVGIAALMTIARTSVADPVVGQGLSLDAMSAAVLGGTYMGGGGVGSVLGAILGTFILGLINNLFNLLNVSAYFQYIAKGAIIVIAVIAGSKALKKKN
jgi:ribose transport system permease protein